MAIAAAATRALSEMVETESACCVQWSRGALPLKLPARAQAGLAGLGPWTPYGCCASLGASVAFDLFNPPPARQRMRSIRLGS